jgi:hypothetical protein
MSDSIFDAFINSVYNGGSAMGYFDSVHGGLNDDHLFGNIVGGASSIIEAMDNFSFNHPLVDGGCDHEESPLVDGGCDHEESPLVDGGYDHEETSTVDGGHDHEASIDNLFSITNMVVGSGKKSNNKLIKKDNSSDSDSGDSSSSDSDSDSEEDKDFMLDDTASINAGNNIELSWMDLTPLLTSSQKGGSHKRRKHSSKYGKGKEINTNNDSIVGYLQCGDNTTPITDGNQSIVGSMNLSVSDPVNEKNNDIDFSISASDVRDLLDISSH